MKRNREQKARIRLVSYFGLDKGQQRMLDEKVKKTGTRYSDIYTDLKQRLKKNRELPCRTTVIMLDGSLVGEIYLVDFDEGVVIPHIDEVGIGINDDDKERYYWLSNPSRVPKYPFGPGLGLVFPTFTI